MTWFNEVIRCLKTLKDVERKHDHRNDPVFPEDLLIPGCLSLHMAYLIEQLIQSFCVFLLVFAFEDQASLQHPVFMGHIPHQDLFLCKFLYKRDNYQSFLRS